MWARTLWLLEVSSECGYHSRNLSNNHSDLQNRQAGAALRLMVRFHRRSVEEKLLQIAEIHGPRLTRWALRARSAECVVKRQIGAALPSRKPSRGGCA